MMSADLDIQLVLHKYTVTLVTLHHNNYTVTRYFTESYDCLLSHQHLLLEQLVFLSQAEHSRGLNFQHHKSSGQKLVYCHSHPNSITQN